MLPIPWKHADIASVSAGYVDTAWCFDAPGNSAAAGYSATGAEYADVSVVLFIDYRQTCVTSLATG